MRHGIRLSTAGKIIGLLDPSSEQESDKDEARWGSTTQRRCSVDGYLQLSKFEMQQLLAFMDHCLYINQADQIQEALNLLGGVRKFV